MTTAYQLRPWTEVVRPHPDVASGDLAMGTYAANLARVAYRGEDSAAVYADPDEFFASTYFTETMRALLVDVFGALSGRPGDRVLQLRTPFGGGKTHTLLALFHLATARAQALNVPELTDVPDPGEVRVAVLSGEYLDPQRGRGVDGRRISTLWGELAFQLGGWPAYEHLLVDGDEGVPPGGELLGELLEGQPPLVLLDEVLVYVVKGQAIRRNDATAGQQAMLFLQNLTEAVNQQRSAAMVYSLQASVGEAVQEEGLLHALEHISARIDARRAPVTGDEVLRVVQRRLFDSVGDEDVRREVARSYGSLLRSELEATAETDDARREASRVAADLEQRIEESYPFHPELLDLMNQRWGSLPTYQRTRGALQFLATVVHALWSARSERTPQALIGPGDVDISDEPTRATLLEQVGESTQYTSVIDADFLAGDAGTRSVDDRLGREAATLERLRVGTRVATAIMLLSFGAREGDDRGALERDVIGATLVPGLDGNVLRAALGDLRGEALLYLHHTGRRYRFEPRPNLNKLLLTEQEKFGADEVLAIARASLESALGDARREAMVLWPVDSAAIRDGVRAFQVAYLRPDWTPGHQALAELVRQCGDAPRRHKNGLALVEPDGQVFDQARQAARTKLAIEALLSRSSRHNFSPEQTEELRDRAKAADRRLASLMGQAYGRVAVPVGTDPESGIRFETIDLGTILGGGRGLHERVREALSHQVFDRLTPARLAAVAHLGERGFAWCDDLAAHFFTFFELTKLWSLDPLRGAIAEGVEKGLFAYAVDVSAEEAELRVGDPSLIRSRQALMADEIDLGPGSALLGNTVADRLLTSVSGPEGAQTMRATDDGAREPVSPPPDEPVAPPQAGNRRGVHLTIDATEDDLLTLQKALAGLRDVTSPGKMRISLSVEASAAGEDSIDPIQFQNRVRQHLEEDEDVRFEERWE